MRIRIRPSRPVRPIEAPPSKSMAHRLLICAGLAEGKSVIRGISGSQDILATIDCLRALGAEVNIDGDTIEITGADPVNALPALLRCRESGSTLRFFTPICALSGRPMELSGSRTLLSRPMSVYEELFSGAGLTFERREDGIAVRGPLRAGEYVMDGSVSSQFISGMMFALPLAGGTSVIRLKPPVESRSYINMTMDAMRRSGIRTEWTDDLTITIPGDQKYQPVSGTVEGDWSNAAFLLAMGAEVTGPDAESLQGDRICTEYFAELDSGCPELDISDCPDLGPVLMAYASLRHGAKLTGTRRLRFKESDRGMTMKEELAKFGIDVSLGEDHILIGNGAHAPEGELSGHNDHRIVMAMAVMCAETGGIIDGAEAAAKSFPDFFDRIKAAGIEAEVLG